MNVDGRNDTLLHIKTFTIIIFYLDTDLDRRYKFPIKWKKVEMSGKKIEESAMFGGENPSTIDGKGRTSMPARFREILVEPHGDERFFLTNASPVDLGDGSYGSGLLSLSPWGSGASLKKKSWPTKAASPRSSCNSIKRQVTQPRLKSACTDKLGRVLSAVFASRPCRAGAGYLVRRNGAALRHLEQGNLQPRQRPGREELPAGIRSAGQLWGSEWRPSATCRSCRMRSFTFWIRARAGSTWTAPWAGAVTPA